MFNVSEILSKINNFYDAQDFSVTDEKRRLAFDFLGELESGVVRTVRFDNKWNIDERVKKAILFCFKQGIGKEVHLGPFSFIDKDNLFPREFSLEQNIRIVPGGVTIRRGAYISENCVFMPPSFVNIGSYIGKSTMIDSNALVGSCAYVGNNVHLSAGAQIGGVLEPIGALPVIIEDDVLVGANSGIFEGTIVKKRAVIAAGVNLTRGVKVFDLVNEQIIDSSKGVLEIPENAVVVMGSRAINSEFAKNNNLSISCPIIIKYRDEKTDSKSALENALR